MTRHQSWVLIQVILETNKKTKKTTNSLTWEEGSPLVICQSGANGTAEAEAVAGRCADVLLSLRGPTPPECSEYPPVTNETAALGIYGSVPPWLMTFLRPRGQLNRSGVSLTCTTFQVDVPVVILVHFRSCLRVPLVITGSVHYVTTTWPIKSTSILLAPLPSFCLLSILFVLLCLVWKPSRG